MGKQFIGPLGSIEKLIYHGVMNIKHPYYDLYQYILLLENENITKNLIKESIDKKLGYILPYERKKTFSDHNIEFKFFPALGNIYNEIHKHDLKIIDAIQNLNDDIKKDLIEHIYNKIFSYNNNKKEIKAEALKRQILNDCYLILSSFKYKDKYLIQKENNQVIVDKNVLYEFYEKLDEKMISNMNIIISDNTLKSKYWEKMIELKNIFKNHETYIKRKILSLLNSKIAEIDKDILGIDNEQIISHKQFHYLEKENVIRTENGITHIVITPDRLRELKLDGKIFEQLNERCRIELIANALGKTKLKTDAKNDELEQFINYQINTISWEGIEPRNIEIELNRIYIEVCSYLKNKLAYYQKEIVMLENNQQLMKDKRLKEIENDSKSNIQCLLQPKVSTMPTGLNTIYILYILMLIEDKKIDNYLNKFIENKNNLNLDARFIAIIKQQSNEAIENYFKENTKQKKKGEL
ncbi:MAG: hypothetical protein J6D28_03505 [Bacilli bacterium]|nr:hypothetical protein [Bacilli bacterium]